MNDLKNQVQLARRRLLMQKFLVALPWTLSATFLVATLAVGATKIWPLPVDPQRWSLAWIGGAAALGVLLAIGWTYLRRTDLLEAAIEIDHRYGLKERVSSCLALTPNEQTTAAGQALLNDAVRRVAQVNVKEQFQVSANRWTLLPACLAGTAFALTLLSDAQPDANSTAQAATLAVQQRVQNSTEALKKKLEERKKTAMEQGLADATELFDKLEKGVDSLNKKDDVDRQKALVKLNDLARDLQERQKELWNREELQKQLNLLKDIKQGPADRMAQAMKQGDFKAALNELKDLQNKLEKGEMSPEEKAALQEQLAQMRDKMQEMASAQEQAKRDLEQQIQQKLAQGDRDAAGKLQNKLDQMAKQDQQMKQMKQLAEQLGQCSQAMQQGQMQDAAAQLGKLAENLEAMQQEMSEMEMLEEALDQISSAKDSMTCSNCNGMGCSQCQGNSDMASLGGQGQDGRGRGMGEGQGEGDRPEEETSTGFYDSQVRSKPGQGKAVVTGVAPGPNKSGEALEEIKVEIESGRHSNDDPLTGQRLPKPQRELTREYFDAFREGQ